MKAKADWILIPILGVLLVAGAAWSFAQAPDPDDDPLPGAPDSVAEFESAQGMMPAMGPDLREQLGLTDEQAEKLRALRVEAMKNGIRTRSSLMIARLELEELMRSDTPDRAAIDAKLRQLTDAHSALLRQHVEHRLTLHGILTPEQRAKARTLLRHHMRQRMFQRRGPGFGPGRGFGPGQGRGRGPGGPPLD